MDGFYWGVEVIIDDGAGLAGLGLATDDAFDLPARKYRQRLERDRLQSDRYAHQIAAQDIRRNRRPMPPNKPARQAFGKYGWDRRAADRAQ